MAGIAGLAGLRPAKDRIAALASPPYDVIKEGSPLERRLKDNPLSFYHATLGDRPSKTLAQWQAQGVLIEDGDPCFLVYEQLWRGGRRLGFFAAVEVTPYTERQIIRHEKTFDEKVKGRIAVTRETGLTLEPIFLLTRSGLGEVLEDVVSSANPEYDFTSDFGGFNDLHGIRSRIFRLPESSAAGRALVRAVRESPLYIADGHHRYHAALLNGQSHTLAYITDNARILAYDRLINGTRPFAEAEAELELEAVETFRTPPKHAFSIYSRQGAFLLRAQKIPSDVVGRLDCSVLEREFYPKLGLDHAMVAQKRHFDYYPESELETMRAKVDAGEYDIAVALHPVSQEELFAVADAGLEDAEIVMPEKSTFFAPKILSGVFLYRHRPR